MNASPSQITVSPTATHARYVVEVNTERRTLHHVNVESSYWNELSLAGCSEAAAIEEAFRFLLEREPNTSILRASDLRQIEHYFPEFRKEIGARLRR